MEADTLITVLDETVDKEEERKNYTAYWNKIIKDIQNSDEALEGEPDRMHIKTAEEISAL